MQVYHDTFHTEVEISESRIYLKVIPVKLFYVTLFQNQVDFGAQN